VRMASGHSAAPSPTDGHEAPPPPSSGRRWLQAAVHVAVAVLEAVEAERAGGWRRERAGSVKASSQVGRHHGGSDGVWYGRVGSIESVGARARSLLDRIHLIYDGQNWAIVD
jgi:hypothetical protein